MQEASNKGFIIGIIIVTVLIFAGLVWAITTAPSGQSPSGSTDEAVAFSDDQDPRVGSPDAKVVVHIYGDFQCPACRSAEPGLKYAMQKYADRVRFVWKDFPLSQIHPNARIAAEAARCAQAQGKFWEYHDTLYRVQPEWASLGDPKNKFTDYANEIGLSQDAFTSCLTSRAEDAKVLASLSEGTRNRVDATPTFLINKRRYFGMNPAEWDQALEMALGEVASSSTTTTR